MKNIYLIGFMGAGKSTVANELEQKTEAERVEMDQMIADAQQMTIAEIFDRFGEAHFRDLETELLKTLHRKEDMIVSCGGGSVLRDENTALMKEHGCIVLLKAEPKTIYERVKSCRDRPVLNGNMNVEFITELMEKRRGRYEAVADFSVVTDGKTAAEISSEILEMVNRVRAVSPDVFPDA